jgi:hypothetical protein
MKLISATVAAIALSFSMMLVPSTANATSTAYPGSVSTFCSFSVPSLSHHHRLTVRMRVRAGNALPNGHVRVRLYKRTSDGTYVRIRNPYRLYSGGLQRFTFRNLPRGHYQVDYHYRPRLNSVFKPCTSSMRSTRVTG